MTDGLPLAEAVAKFGPLPPDSVLALAARLARVIKAGHAVGTRYPDLQPSAVLLTADGPHIAAGNQVPEPSPEQALGTPVGPATDIYLLGAVLTFAACGHGPFDGGSPSDRVMRLIYEPPNLHGVPDEVRPLIERCVAKGSADRPTADDLVAELGDIQPDAPWLPERVDKAVVPRPRKKRHVLRWAVAAAVVIVAGLGILGAVDHSGAQKPLSFMAPGLTSQACSAAGTVESPRSTDRVTIHVVNNSASPVRWIWLSYTGGQELYATIKPGYEIDQSTYTGHYWMVASQSGQCAGLFRVSRGGELTVS